MARKNTTQKGNAIQREARVILEAEGYEVEVARPKVIWIRPGKPISVGTDLWGRIDLVCVHPTRPPRLIQCSVPSELGRKRKLLTGWTPHGCSVEVWIWHGGRGKHFRIYNAPDFAISTFTVISKREPRRRTEQVLDHA